MSMTVVVDGSGNYGPDLRAAIIRALEQSGIVIESGAKMECPVVTGRLRNSITHETDGGELSCVIGTDVEYGKYVHEHRKHPQPFLRNSIVKNSDNVRSIFERELKS